MDILSFVLGVSMVLILMGVMVIFSMYRKIKELGEKLKTTINIQNEQFVDYQNTKEEIHRRIDREIDRVDRISNDIYRIIDSRFDKLENKLKTNSSKQIINE